MSKTLRVNSNLLQQNCYVRDSRVRVDLVNHCQNYQYTSLDEELTKNGLKVKSVVNDYPITPEYVNSFVNSTDYHVDPLNAVNNGVKRFNLGDVSGIQDILSLDTASIRPLYEQLKQKFEVSVSNNFNNEEIVSDEK